MKDSIDNLVNQDNDSKRSNNSNKNDSERKNELDLQKEDLNKISNRSENGSDKNHKNEEDNQYDKMEYDQETTRTEPDRPNFFTNLCSGTSNKNKTIAVIKEVNELEQDIIERLNEYLDSDNLSMCLEGVEEKTKNQFIDKCKKYIDRFVNPDNYEDNMKIKTMEKFISKILNFYIEFVKDSDKYKVFKENIMSIYGTIYNPEENEANNFSFNENDISRIEYNENDISRIDNSRNNTNTNTSDNPLRLDLSELNSETTDRNKINEDNMKNKNEQSVEKMEGKEGYSTVVYGYYKYARDLVTTKAQDYFKSKGYTVEKNSDSEMDGHELSAQERQKLRDTFNSMKDEENFVNTKGGTVEGSPNLEINPNTLADNQLDNEEFVEHSNGYSCYQYAGTAIVVCVIIQALNFMSQMDHDYHGFGPSGF